MEIAHHFASGHRSGLAEYSQAGIEANTEHSMLRKDGQVITVEAHGKTLSYRGRATRVTAIRDITAERLAADSLRKLPGRRAKVRST